jgi:hypothetical protein
MAIGTYHVAFGDFIQHLLPTARLRQLRGLITLVVGVSMVKIKHVVGKFASTLATAVKFLVFMQEIA